MGEKAIQLRGIEGSKPSKVKHTCPECGQEFEGKIGYAVKCPRCDKLDVPKYTKKFIDILREGFSGSYSEEVQREIKWERKM